LGSPKAGARPRPYNLDLAPTAARGHEQMGSNFYMLRANLAGKSGPGEGKRGWRPGGAESWGNEVRRCAAKRSCHRPSTPCHTHKKDARTPNLGQNQLVSQVEMGRERVEKELEEEDLALHQLAADWR